MTDLRTERLILHPVDVGEAERIVARRPASTDSWAPDFPFEGDAAGARSFLRANIERGPQQPFGFYLVTRLADGRAVGGVGFTGPPNDGQVEIGYGLSPSARIQGFAGEAVKALVSWAATSDVTRVIACTTHDNVASQRTLLGAGFTLETSDDEWLNYAINLEVGP